MNYFSLCCREKNPRHIQPFSKPVLTSRAASTEKRNRMTNPLILHERNDLSSIPINIFLFETEELDPLSSRQIKIALYTEYKKEHNAQTAA